jgi:hypothetical protein
MFLLDKVIKFTIAILLTASTALAADLEKLTQLFQENYNTFYVPRFCGPNTARLIQAAQDQKIDLSNSYVLKIVGAGFLETSGFYTRSAPNERQMLGYFQEVVLEKVPFGQFINLDSVLSRQRLK